MNYRPNPFRSQEMLDPTSKTWLEHDESYQPIVGEKQVTLYAPRAYACESTPEFQEILGTAITAQVEAGRRGMVMREVIACQEQLRAAADPDNRITSDEEDRKTLLGAANLLYRPVAELKARRESNLEQQRKSREALERMRATERSANPIDGMTNTEMSDLLQSGKHEQRAAIERDGCCGGPPMEDGFCFGLGMCPREVEVKRCTTFCERYLQWVEQAASESALADVSARLSVPSS